MKDIGICIFCEKVDYRDILDLIKAAGIKYVMPHEKKNDFRGQLEYLRKIGLKVAFAHLAYDNINELWQDTPKRQKAIAQKIASIKLCAEFGIDTVVIHPTHNRHLCKAIDAVGLDSYKQILAVAKDCGIKIALENLGKSDIPSLEFLLDNISSPYLGLCYDCGHHYLHARENDIMGKYGNRCFAIHIHDNNFDDDAHLLPTDGKVDFARVMKQLKNSSYKGALLLEVRQYKNLTHAEFLQQAIQKGEKLIK